MLNLPNVIRHGVLRRLDLPASGVDVGGGDDGEEVLVDGEGWWARRKTEE